MLRFGDASCVIYRQVERDFQFDLAAEFTFCAQKKKRGGEEEEEEKRGREKK